MLESIYSVYLFLSLSLSLSLPLLLLLSLCLSPRERGFPASSLLSFDHEAINSTLLTSTITTMMTMTVLLTII